MPRHRSILLGKGVSVTIEMPQHPDVKAFAARVAPEIEQEIRNIELAPDWDAPPYQATQQETTLVGAGSC